MGGDLDMSVILINDKMIENIEILNHSGSNQVFTKFRNNSVYYSSEISLVNGYDSNDNVVTYKCLDDSFCVP